MFFVVTGVTALRGVTSNLSGKEMVKGWQGMLKRIGRCLRKKLLRSSSGAALTEVVVAIVILALIVGSVPPVLLLIVKAQSSWSEQRIAESLIRNHVEYVKVQPYIAGYIDGNQTVQYPQYIGGNATEEMPPVPSDDWSVIVQAVPIYSYIDPDTGVRRKVDFSAGEEDQGIQEITVTVEHVDRLVLESKNYKVDRQEIWR